MIRFAGSVVALGALVFAQSCGGKPGFDSPQQAAERLVRTLEKADWAAFRATLPPDDTMDAWVESGRCAGQRRPSVQIAERETRNFAGCAAKLRGATGVKVVSVEGGGAPYRDGNCTKPNVKLGLDLSIGVEFLLDGEKRKLDLEFDKPRFVDGRLYYMLFDECYSSSARD